MARVVEPKGAGFQPFQFVFGLPEKMFQKRWFVGRQMPSKKVGQIIPKVTNGGTYAKTLRDSVKKGKDALDSELNSEVPLDYTQI